MSRGPLTDAQVSELADHLLGTAGSLESAAEALFGTEDLEPEDCARLDQEVFCCDACGWWCEIAEMAEGDEWICEDCAVDDNL